MNSNLFFLKIINPVFQRFNIGISIYLFQHDIAIKVIKSVLNLLIQLSCKCFFFPKWYRIKSLSSNNKKYLTHSTNDFHYFIIKFIPFMYSSI